SRQVHTDPQLFAVVQIDFRPSHHGLALPHRGRRFVLQRFENRFNVFAGAQSVGAKIRARARVVADFETANLDRVLPAGVGVDDLVIGKHTVAAEVLDGEVPFLGTPPANIDLFLAEHDAIPSRSSGSPNAA